ncbi:hypothetical protein QZG57_09695 [Corynebacterium glucuronolyticum]|uniref:hypothetical protein n=1 Tax=Corynebacterium glucuronolyticum TaxID=39791 RepID=UPI003F6E00D9
MVKKFSEAFTWPAAHALSAYGDLGQWQALASNVTGSDRLSEVMAEVNRSSAIAAASSGISQALAAIGASKFATAGIDSAAKRFASYNPAAQSLAELGASTYATASVAAAAKMIASYNPAAQALQAALLNAFPSASVVADTLIADANPAFGKFLELQRSLIEPPRIADLTSWIRRDSATPHLPDNIKQALEEVSLKEIRSFLLSEGIGIFGVPRTSITTRLLKATSHSSRRDILGNSAKQIIADCKSALTDEVQEKFSPSNFALLAIEAAEDGHFAPAQALLATTLDTSITKLIPTSDKAKKKIKTKNEEDKAPLNYETATEFRQALGWLPVWNAHQVYWPQRGDKIPLEFSRHATIHAASKRQYTKRNFIQALLVTVSLCIYATESLRNYWGVLPIRN